MTHRFVHLHNHSYYSLLDGAIPVTKLVDTALEMGMGAVALTDHGNMLGAIEFYDYAMSKGIKPIIGIEMYLAPTDIATKDRSNYHILLLAKDTLGYKNLLRLSSISYLEGFYYKPRIDKKILRQFSGGLIGLSACIKGEVPQHLINDNYDMARTAAEEYNDIFGAGNFYLELQKHGLDEEKKVNAGIMRVAEDTGLPVVATNDVHYLKKDDAEAHQVLLCIQTLSKLKDADKFRMRGSGYHFKTYDEMKNDFPDYEPALENTLAIADKCNVLLDFDKYYMPNFDVPPEFADDYAYLKNLCDSRLQDYAGSMAEPKKAEYRARLDYELGIIKKMGFPAYFLIVSDFIHYAKTHDINIGPGRGSAGGSLVAFLLEITEVDPIKYSLIFERFLNEERISMPDIDTDVEDVRRKDLIHYLTEKYGKEYIASICTFSRMRARRVIRDVGRVLDISNDKLDKLLKILESSPDDDLLKLALNSRFTALLDDDADIKRLYELSRKFVGFPRNISTHAAGIVIAPQNTRLSELVPLMTDKNDETITQYDMSAVEKIGLLKIDILGNSNLTVIKNTVTFVRARHDDKFNITEIPLDDGDTLELFKAADTNGIFQLDESGMQSLMQQVQVQTFDDIVHLLALYRPGPLKSGMVNDFIARKLGKKPVTFIHPLLENILRETYGIILFQEQVMQIAHELAGFSMSKADELRKGMGKKIPDVIDALKNDFIEGCVNNGISNEIAEKTFELIAYFSGYGFNKAHSVSYALIAYRAAYLKAHFFPEYWTSVLNYDFDHKSDMLMKHIEEARRHKVSVLLPDVNKSAIYFSIDEKNIRFGLSTVKNVGTALAADIIRIREEKGAYTDLFDFCKKVHSTHINSKALESLIKAGAFDSLGEPRAQLSANMENAQKQADYFERTEATGQFSLFEEAPASDEKIECAEWDDEIKYRFEREMLGIVLSGNPLEKYEFLRDIYGISKIEAFSEQSRQPGLCLGIVSNISYKTSASGNRIARVSFSDGETLAEIIVRREFFQKLVEAAPVVAVLAPADRYNKDRPVFFVNEIFTPDEFVKIYTDKVRILLPKTVTKKQIADLKSLFDSSDGVTEIKLFFRGENDELFELKTEKPVRISPSISFLREIMNTSSQIKVIKRS